MFFLTAAPPRSWPSFRICHACIRKYASGSRKAPNSVIKERNLPDHPVRTRFAPSPTGYLHLGSLRTALFNYLLAKATRGQFLLRIEDTDQKRTVHDSEERLCDDLHWAGLDWDEGPRIGGPYGPYHQSQRTALYREHAEQLLDTGNAYRCFCTPEKLESLAVQRMASGLQSGYDRTCFHLSDEESQDRAANGEAHVVRLKNPYTHLDFTDAVYGTLRSQAGDSQMFDFHLYDDIILLKSDGFPTYHLANVVDDHHMKISHVIRGSEWLNSTPKHLVMYDAFGWKAPEFAHVGLLVDQAGQKLSKRNLGQDISVFRDEMGLFPETLTNYVALLGWSHQRQDDIMDLQELVNNFSMKFTRGNTVASFEKLWFLQRNHAERRAIAAQKGDSSKIRPVLGLLKSTLTKTSYMENLEHLLEGRQLDGYLKGLFYADAGNYTTAGEFVERNRYFFIAPSDEALKDSRDFLLQMSRHRHLPTYVEQIVSPEKHIDKALESLTLLAEQDWTIEKIKEHIQAILSRKADESLAGIVDFETKREYKHSDVAWKKLKVSWSAVIHRGIRWALTSGVDGPSVTHALEILGRSETLSRISRARAILLNPDELSATDDHDLDEKA